MGAGDRSFPSHYELVQLLLRLGVPPGAATAAPERIIQANDDGDFAAAWGVLAEALAAAPFGRLRPVPADGPHFDPPAPCRFGIHPEFATAPARPRSATRARPTC